MATVTQRRAAEFIVEGNLLGKNRSPHTILVRMGDVHHLIEGSGGRTRSWETAQHLRSAADT